MNGGYRGYFWNDGYDGMQRGFNSFNNSAGLLMLLLVVALIVFVV